MEKLDGIADGEKYSLKMKRWDARCTAQMFYTKKFELKTAVLINRRKITLAHLDVLFNVSPNGRNKSMLVDIILGQYPWLYK